MQVLGKDVKKTYLCKYGEIGEIGNKFLVCLTDLLFCESFSDEQLAL